jgi:hypothetical protein
MPDRQRRPRPKSTTRRKWYKDQPIIDRNARVVGKVIDVEKRRGNYYVIVDFKGRTQALLLIGDDDEYDELPRTPHFIREARSNHPTDWYRWQWSSLEDPFVEDQPGGEYTVTIAVHASASASADNQQMAVDYFSKVVAAALVDILQDELIKRGESDSYVQTISKVLRTGRDTFEATITVRLFTPPATAEDLLQKLYVALDDGTGEASFWPELLRQEGVERVHASSFTLAGWAGSQRVAPVKGRLRLV